jgi:hypothetical protein
MASSPSEHEIQQRIRLACGRGPVRLWRNNTGALVDRQGRLVRFGLCRGSSDLISLRSLEITPELVGQRIAQFVALEPDLAAMDKASGSAEVGDIPLSLLPVNVDGAPCPDGAENLAVGSGSNITGRIKHNCHPCLRASR